MSALGADAVMARLRENAGQWVGAADITPLIPRGEFWALMDVLVKSGRVLKWSPMQKDHPRLDGVYAPSSLSFAVAA